MTSLIKSIMKLKEEDVEKVVFSKDNKEEGGINSIYDPAIDKELYQVFVQRTFPYRELFSKEFEEFREARNFAATYFKEGWQMLSWDKTLNRPCGKGDDCKGGNCSTGKEGEESSCGGGCTTCGATKDFDELMEED